MFVDVFRHKHNIEIYSFFDKITGLILSKVHKAYFLTGGP